MLKLKTSYLACPLASIRRLMQVQSSVLMLTLIACLGSYQFSDSARAQWADDSVEGDLISIFGSESDLMSGPYLAEPTLPIISLAGSDCCPETLEPFAHKQNRSLSTIKCALGGTELIEIRPEDELWIVSARNFDGCVSGGESLEVKRLANNSWQTASLDQLAECHQKNTSLTTLLYAHGNQTNYDYGVSRGVQFYRNLVSCPEVDGAIRMVLWLWKSERQSVRMYRDFRIKSQRAIEMGAAFRSTLERLGDSRVALVGFSLGTQVILSALDSIEDSCGRDRDAHERYKVALVAPALDPAYACASADRSICSSITDQTRVFNNRADRAVKALRIILRRECPTKSISFDRLVDEQCLNLGQVKKVDLTSETGARHSIVRYSRTPSLCCELGKLLSEVANKRNVANQPVPNNQFAVE